MKLRTLAALLCALALSLGATGMVFAGEPTCEVENYAQDCPTATASDEEPTATASDDESGPTTRVQPDRRRVREPDRRRVRKPDG